MLTKFVILFLIVLVVQVTSVRYTYRQECFSYECPRSTIRCQKHTHAAGSDDMFIVIRCLGENDRELKRHDGGWIENNDNSIEESDVYARPKRVRCSSFGLCRNIDERIGSSAPN